MYIVCFYVCVRACVYILEEMIVREPVGGDRRCCYI